MLIDFEHRHAAHCETGATSNLLNYHGLDLSEALLFGIGGGLAFVHIPFKKMYGMPVTFYRNMPGLIIKRVCKGLGIKFKFQKFKKPEDSMSALDKALDQGFPAACQTGVYWLPYFPPLMRFHFNGHNIVVIGRNGGTYTVSDPSVDEPVEITAADLIKARYAQGPLFPKGLMYYPTKVPKNPDLVKPVRKGVKIIIRNMTMRNPNLTGLRAIRHVAGEIPEWPNKMGPEMARQVLAHIIRMQEEVGTGGAGFRFIFASFLAEAAEILNKPELRDISEQMTLVGDAWRIFALKSARIIKRQSEEQDKFAEAGRALAECGDMEEKIYQSLRQAGF